MESANYGDENIEVYQKINTLTDNSIYKLFHKTKKINCLLCKMIYNKKTLILLIVNNMLIEENELSECILINENIENDAITSNNFGVIFRENKGNGISVVEIITSECFNSDSLVEIDFNMLQNNKENDFINNFIFLMNHSYEISKRKIINITSNEYVIEQLKPSEKIPTGNPILIKSDSIKLLGIYTGNDGDSHFGSFIKEPIQEFIKKYNDSILIIYKTPKKLKIKIFDKNFVDNNNECKIIIKGKIEDIKEYIEIDKTDIRKGQINIKLINRKRLDYLDFMFFNCEFLYSLPDLEKFNDIGIISTRGLFNGCKLLEKLSDISNWNTNSLSDMRYMFSGCERLKVLPDLSKWNTKIVTNIDGLFNGCKSIKCLPDISKWNTLKVEDMNNTFNGLSLISLPDISKWQTNKVTNMSNMFEGCTKLEILPDISKWSTNQVICMMEMFKGCEKLEKLPDISKWKTSNVTNFMNIFMNCSSLTELPDISQWETNKVRNMKGMFDGCKNLLYLPDISKWVTKETINLTNLFRNCSSLSKIPDISGWEVQNVREMNSLFEGCSSLTEICNLNKWVIKKNAKILRMFDKCISLTYLPFNLSIIGINYTIVEPLSLSSSN